MEAQKFNQYLNAIKPIEAELHLKSIESNMYPHLKKEKRSEIYRDLLKKIRESIQKTSRVLSYEEVRSNLLRKLRGG